MFQAFYMKAGRCLKGSVRNRRSRPIGRQVSLPQFHGRSQRTRDSWVRDEGPYHPRDVRERELRVCISPVTPGSRGDNAKEPRRAPGLRPSRGALSLGGTALSSGLRVNLPDIRPTGRQQTKPPLAAGGTLCLPGLSVTRTSLKSCSVGTSAHNEQKHKTSGRRPPAARPPRAPKGRKHATAPEGVGPRVDSRMN